MRVQPKLAALCLLCAAVAAASWAVADVVTLNPGEITGQVSFSAEAVTGFHVKAVSDDGPSASKSFTTNPYSLMVESGHDYKPTVYAYFNDPTGAQSQLSIQRLSAVTVNNANGPTTVDFSYSNTNHVDFSLNVAGGVISEYVVYTAASAGTEHYGGRSTRSFSNPRPSSVSGWTAMVADDVVKVEGTVSLVTADGLAIKRPLSAQTVNVLQGPANVSWSFDLTDTGTLAGDVELSPGSGISSHKLHFSGVHNTASYGISGSKSISANGSYAIDLLPGDYDVLLQTAFASPNHVSETKLYRVTVTSGSTTVQDFIELMGTGQVALNVGGFFSSAQISTSYVGLRRKDSWTRAVHYAPVNGLFDFSLVSGEWQRRELYLKLYDVSDPQLPLNNIYNRYYDDDSSVPWIAVPAGAAVSLGSEDVTLVKTNLYFDVKEASPQAPEILVSSPYVYAKRFEHNADGTWKRRSYVGAYGSSTPAALAAFTMAAEPGVYSLEAFATVNGGTVEFSGQNITFAEPVDTGAGPNVSVTPIQADDRVVDLTFDNVTIPGITTVVETPMGPEAPEGLKAFCEDGASTDGIECSPIYYDIKTTAAFDGPVTVCVRRKFLGANGMSGFLRLYHYNENAAPGVSPWERLELPAGEDAAIDCSADLSACGCADEASCGIDYNADPPVSVIKVCGVTSSFSPFAIFKEKKKFTNEVNGQSYEGKSGPIQSWTVPANGVYRITATGARGAAASQAQGIAGGCGSQIAGTFTLQGGDDVKILVGQKGTSTPYSGGGGGGSFVVLNGTPLVIAGGGGGARSGATVNGRHGSIGTAGVAGSVSANYTSGFIAGGTNGSGGGKASSFGSGGGGFSGSGASDGSYGEGGFSFLLGGNGGAGKSCGALAHGGFGGGGAGNGCYGGGGGGGYSGGGSGRVGGGGGSWNAGADPAGEAGACTPSGHGLVTIEYIPGP